MSGQRIMRRLNRRLTPIALVLLTLLGVDLLAAASASARRPDGHPTASPFQLFDANVGYTSGIFLPLATYTPASVRPFTTQTWSDAARPVSRVAADGATLLLILAELPPGVGSAAFSVRSEQLPAADPGSLWAVDRKSTRLNSSHITISYAVFCLKKKKKKKSTIKKKKKKKTQERSAP